MHKEKLFKLSVRNKYMSQQSTEILGLQKLRQGALYYIIASLLGIIVAIGIISTLIAIPSGTASAIGIIVALIGALITLPLIVLSYLRTRDGFKLLVYIGKDLKGGITATTFILLGIIVLLLGILIMLPLAITSVISGSLLAVGVTVGIGIAIILIGAILSFIGFILLALAYRKTGEIYNNDSLKTGGLLLLIGSIIGIIISIIGYILDLIGFIMIYSGLGNLINTIQKSPTIPAFQTYPAFTPSAPISEVGTGILRSNGIAEVTIYTQFPVQILSATLLGTSFVTTDVIPNQLNVGYNRVVINFRVSLAFVPGNLYTIQLSLSNGQTLNVTVTYQP